MQTAVLPYSEPKVGMRVGIVLTALASKTMVADMALSTRNSRRIVVDGVPYRWVLSMDSGYAMVTVQHGSGSGQRLEAQTGP